MWPNPQENAWYKETILVQEQAWYKKKEQENHRIELVALVL